MKLENQSTSNREISTESENVLESKTEIGVMDEIRDFGRLLETFIPLWGDYKMFKNLGAKTLSKRERIGLTSLGISGVALKYSYAYLLIRDGLMYY